MLNASERLHQDDGFSLVELLIAMFLAAVVGGVAVSGIVGGLQQSARTQDRIDAFNELQLAMERMSREVRAADPIIVATDTRIEVQVRRDGQCSQFSYELTGDVLRVQRDVSNDDCETFTTGMPTPLASEVVNPVGRPMFSYQTHDGSVATTEDEIGVVNIEIQRDIPDQPPVAVSTVVNVRNS